ncbi:MAG: CPBP family intramembrane metalloprotease [Lachnospiraceae bacterium]|nr:CPBP family intramembrane metalloprotease [Lachnospiraceae bacterium]
MTGGLVMKAYKDKNIRDEKPYKYRPVLFFALAYLFTWIFWIPAIFVHENIGAVLMFIGLLAPAVVSTVFVLTSKSTLLKKDLKVKLIGLYKVKWVNVLLAILQFGGIVVASILLSLLFGQSLDQFSFTKDFNFTGVGIAGAFASITLASIIEEVGWKGYCEDSIGAYMNWFWESMLFGAIWSLWHFPLIFIKGTYQATLMVNPLFVINFFVSAIPMGFIITWVYLASDRSILACMIYHLVINFLQEKIAMTPETKCVETLVVTAVAAIIVITNREMFFSKKHVGRLLETRYGAENISGNMKALASE